MVISLVNDAIDQACSVQSSQPRFLKTLNFVYILIATRRVATVKHTDVVTVPQIALEGGLT